MKGIYLTKDGVEKLKAELKHLVEVERKDIIKKIKETREYGDLSENAEYDEARNQQSMIEGKIEELEAVLKNAKVISCSDKPKDKIALGCKSVVEVEGEKMEFTIVSSAESDPLTGMISDQSPLGKALIGAKVGQDVKVAIPDGGSIVYKIVSIS